MRAPKFGAIGEGLLRTPTSMSCTGRRQGKQAEINQAVIQPRRAPSARCTSGMGLAEKVFSARLFTVRVGTKQQEGFMENRRSTGLVGWICAVVMALATTPSFAQQ